MSLEQQVGDLLRDGQEDEAVLVLARAVDRLGQSQAEAERLQRLAQQGFEGR